MLVLVLGGLSTEDGRRMVKNSQCLGTRSVVEFFRVDCKQKHQLSDTIGAKVESKVAKLIIPHSHMGYWGFSLWK